MHFRMKYQATCRPLYIFL